MNNNNSKSDMLDSMTVEISGIKDTIFLLSALLSDRSARSTERIDDVSAALSAIGFHLERISNELDGVSSDIAAAELFGTKKE